MEMKELHDHLFEILCTMDDICRKENVRWFLDSGTEIGAVRDGDFIPWDDDADTKILVEDYPAFKAAMEKHLPPYMHLVEPWDFAPGFYCFTSRIYDERYPFREPNEEDDWYHDYLRFVCVDIFMFTKAPASKWVQKWMIFHTRFLHGLGMNYKYKILWNKFSWMEKLQVVGTRMINKLLGLKAEQLCHKWWRFVRRYEGRDCAFRFAGSYGPRTLQFFPDNLYSGTAYAELRGRPFPVPSGYDEELRLQYGDYMTPVKDGKRYIQHQTIQ